MQPIINQIVSDPNKTLNDKNLNVDHFLSNEEGFLIFTLEDVFTDLPYSSIVFRPNHFTFLIVKDADGEFQANEYKFHISQQTIFFCNPGHSRSFVWKDIREAFVVIFTEQFIKTNVHPEIFSQLPFLYSEFVEPKKVNDILFDHFFRTCAEMNKEFHSDLKYRKKVLGNLLMVLLFKIKEYFWKDYDPHNEGDKGSAIVRTFRMNLEDQIRKLVSGQLDIQPRVTDFAALQNLHENYLNAVIKAKTGKSAKALIAEKIICEAKRLLQHTALSNKEICYRLGFIESSNFNTHFKKNTGMTPQEYRRNSLNRATNTSL